VGFSIKLAPGVRIRASSRGVRASVGPRVARVHVGGGRTGISTGVGPVGFYTSLGGGQARGARRSAAPSAASYQRQIAAQQHTAAQAPRTERARALADAFLKILNVHRAEFVAAAPPVAPPPPSPDRAAIYQHYEKNALAGLSVFKRSQRAEATRQAAASTEAEVQRLWTEACQRQQQWQQYLDDRWRRLCANDPDVVIETLEEAFEDNEAPAAAVGANSDEVSLVVLVAPAEDAIPEQMPTTTQAGNLSLRKLPQRDRADYFKQFVCGQVLVTIREAFAVAPGLKSATVAAIRNDGKDAYGKPRVSCILAARFDRAALVGVRWGDADAAAIVNDVAIDKILVQRGRSKDLSPIDLAGEPALTQLLEAVDLDDLTADK
jgi:hypothetical protein